MSRIFLGHVKSPDRWYDTLTCGKLMVSNLSHCKEHSLETYQPLQPIVLPVTLNTTTSITKGAKYLTFNFSLW